MSIASESPSFGSDRLVSGVLVCIFTIVIVITSSINLVTNERLNDGSLTGSGRYTITFDAYELIESDMEKSVIFLGSSKMREAIDGHLIEELGNHQYSVYNLAYAGERPYHRMVEIDSLIQSNPDIVVLELGPTSFSPLSNPLSGGNLDKMKLLMSLSNESPKRSSYYDLISDFDKPLLPSDSIETLEFINTFTPKAYEKSLGYITGLEDSPYDCDTDVQCAPISSSEDFENYLRYPPQFPDWLKLYREQNREEIYFGKHLDSFYNSSLHSAEGIYSKNHMAYDFIINSLVESNITVILVALPYHPRAQEYAPNEHWSYVNNSILEYQKDSRIITIDWFWEDFGNESFIDISHFSRVGEIETANRLNLVIEECLE